MQRTFGGYQSLGVTGTPQPVFGTTLTAAVTAKLDFQGNPTIQGQQINVANALAFNKGDEIKIVETNGTKFETCHIIGVTIGVSPAGTLTLDSLQNNHGSGAFVILAQPCAGVCIQGVDGAAGAIGVGNGSTLTYVGSVPGGANLIWKMMPQPSGQQPPYFSSTMVYGANPTNTVEYWIVGTANDQYLPSAIIS
jgi:hypothetical protein